MWKIFWSRTPTPWTQKHVRLHTHTHVYSPTAQMFPERNHTSNIRQKKIPRHIICPHWSQKHSDLPSGLPNIFWCFKCFETIFRIRKGLFGIPKTCPVLTMKYVLNQERRKTIVNFLLGGSNWTLVSMIYDQLELQLIWSTLYLTNSYKFYTLLPTLWEWTVHRDSLAGNPEFRDPV